MEEFFDLYSLEAMQKGEQCTHRLARRKHKVELDTLISQFTQNFYIS